MARIQSEAADRVYDMVQRWVEVALRQDSSLFTPERSIWAPDVIDEFHQLHVQAPSPDGGSFESNLLDQLAGGTAACWQFAAELVFVHFLIVSERAVGRSKKLELIERLLEKDADGAEVPDELREVMADGFVHPGQGFNQMRHAQIGFLTEFVRAWKALAAEARQRTLADPWEFKRFALSVEPHGGLLMRNALLHLVHPDTFERVIVGKAKRQIVKRFAELVTTEQDDEDRQLLDIRAGLEPEFGPELDFYQPALVSQWQPDTTPWGRTITWAARFYKLPNYDGWERDYKFEIAERMRLAVESGRVEELKAALRSSKNNLLPPMNKVHLRNWMERAPEAALEALRAATDPDEPPLARARGFLELLPDDIVPGLHSRARVLAFAVFTGDPEQLPPYQMTPYHKAYELTDDGPSPIADDPVGVYEQALAFLDRFVEEAAARGLELRDRLDAQSLLYTLVNDDPPQEWDDVDRRAFARWRGEAIDEEGDEETTTPVDDPRPRGDLAALSERLYLGDRFLPHVRQLLGMKPQVIFYGPPGTGKTYVAQRLAEAMAGTDGHVEIVQFHPSYSYEDFVEGYRPDPERGGFRLVDGPLKRLAKRAIEHADVPHVLIIDELNRGNVAKVFGELYFLLEYRGSKLSLQYSSEPFRLPDNLYVIGTMNTADRSIALVDAALRRRFYFVPFMTDEEPVSGLLRRWIADNASHMSWVADLVDEANRRLGDRHAAIGPSHFLRKEGLTDESVRIAWRYSILPYLEEQLFGEPERLDEFGLDELTRALRATVEGEVDAASDAS
ncbi:McrB family protein [Egicoccus sp. AB-alg2]|uniref:McrB family protein n=1 Tax=Egicoccus sp. AB-alg2 TaxID=3242693 RepID=UPI00359F01A6